MQLLQKGPGKLPCLDCSSPDLNNCSTSVRPHSCTSEAWLLVTAAQGCMVQLRGI